MQRYPFLRFATTVLRVVGWIVLIAGVVCSIVLGAIMGRAPADGVVGGIGNAIVGVFVAIAGIIGSFLTWLFLLATRELFYLLIQVEENTRNTAERITIAEKSSQD
jgi:nicotinamide riboside transporter PnuC